MVLSDGDIIHRIGYGDLKVEPYEEDNVEPASMDLRLGDDFKRPLRRYRDKPVDTTDPNDDSLMYGEPETIDGAVVIHPGDFILATTKERIELPDDLVAEVLGRSSLGRLGLSVHQTAGFIDPGFEGEITLEISNHGPADVRLQPGLRICQIVFSELSSPAREPYGHDGSQYQNQSGATPSGMQFE